MKRLRCTFLRNPACMNGFDRFNGMVRVSFSQAVSGLLSRIPTLKSRPKPPVYVGVVVETCPKELKRSAVFLLTVQKKGLPVHGWSIYVNLIPEGVLSKKNF